MVHSVEVEIESTISKEGPTLTGCQLEITGHFAKEKNMTKKESKTVPQVPTEKLEKKSGNKAKAKVSDEMLQAMIAAQPSKQKEKNMAKKTKTKDNVDLKSTLDDVKAESPALFQLIGLITDPNNREVVIENIQEFFEGAMADPQVQKSVLGAIDFYKPMVLDTLKNILNSEDVAVMLRDVVGTQEPTSDEVEVMKKTIVSMEAKVKELSANDNKSSESTSSSKSKKTGFLKSVKNQVNDFFEPIEEEDMTFNMDVRVVKPWIEKMRSMY